MSPVERNREDYSRFRGVIDRITYPDLEFLFQWNFGQSPQVRVSCPDGKCNVTGQPMPWKGRWHRLSPHMTDGEIAQTCFLAVILANEHETRESFKVDGVACFQPHYSLDALVAFARKVENTQERDAPERATEERAEAHREGYGREVGFTSHHEHAKVG